MSSTDTFLTSYDWNEDACIKLIREYRARPLLWDTKCPLFFKKQLKLQAWEDIGKIFNIPAADCKHKMIVLLSSFRREKARTKSKIIGRNNDSGTNYVSSWFGFREMAFLMDKDSERKRLAESSFEEDDEERDIAPRSKKTSRYMVSIGQINKQNKLLRIPHMRHTKMTSRDENIVNQSQSSSAQTVHTAQQITQLQRSDFEEEIKSFATFIANKMKKYTETTKNAVQQAICEVIFKADQGVYESYTNYENYCNNTPKNEQLSEYNTNCDVLDNRLQEDSDENTIVIKQIIESEDSE